MYKIYGFWNGQGCFLQSFRAVSAQAARRQFLRRWTPGHGVTCREID